MEDRDRSRSPSRRTSKVEQVVGRWLRRSRESTSRERVLDEDGKAAEEGPQEPRSRTLRVTILIDPELNDHGFIVSANTPPQVQEVAAGGPADGKLFPGDQLVKINDVALDDLSTEQTADVIKECRNTITLTVLRITGGPKSSFLTPEKRAKLKSNPAKVRFAEEVVVNGHLQGNALLFLPNVLKVYLENGQTKAFKFEPKTTVKDIVMTLKEKLSISRIEHFSLVLEKQYSVSKLFLLHDDELMREVVQKESSDYRCLFRVCFVPKRLEDMLEEDPVAFEYLYLQSVSDVLQERFAVEMKCNTALRLAALHIQERLASTGQSPKTPLKTIMKDWGLECFISSTILRNMKDKDLRKAMGYQMKKILLQEHKQKMTVSQARLSYLSEMSELKSFGGKSFSATMMLQDRESTVSLLVGARYGVSQVINHKMSIMTTLTEFSSITRVELIPESDRISVVKIYLQDIKPITLLLECGAAKDLSCLVAGYCRLFIDPQSCVFPWTVESKRHRISAEEGYVSRCCSDSEDSDVDVSLGARPTGAARSYSKGAFGEVAVQGDETMRRKKEAEDKSEKDLCESVALHAGAGEMGETDGEPNTEVAVMEAQPQFVLVVDDPLSETSDSCQTDSRFLTSMSSDSIDALEEDDILTYFPTGQSHLDTRDSYVPGENLLPSPSPSNPQCQDSDFSEELCFLSSDDQFLSMAALSSIAGCLPSPPEASDDEDYDEQSGQVDGQKSGVSEDTSEDTEPSRGGCVFTFEQGDARHYYNICSNVTPDSAHLLARPASPRSSQKSQEGKDERRMELAPTVLAPLGFGESSSDEEFFDAQERFVVPEEHLTALMITENSTQSSVMKLTCSLSNIAISSGEGEHGDETEQLWLETKAKPSRFDKRDRKRRSYMETDYTSLVSFPEQDQNQIQYQQSRPRPHDEGFVPHFDGGPSDQTSCPTVLSLTDAEGEPAQLESKPITPSKVSGPGGHALRSNNISKASQRKQQLILMEPDSMEVKSVTELMSTASSAIVAVRTSLDPKVNGNLNESAYVVEDEGAVASLDEGLLSGHLFFSTSVKKDKDDISPVKMCNQQSLKEEPSQDASTNQLSQFDQTPPSILLSFKAPDGYCTRHPNTGSLERDDNIWGTQECLTEPTLKTRSQSMSSIYDRIPSVCCTSDFLCQSEPLVHIKETLSDGSSSEPSIQELSSIVSSAEPTQGYLFTQCSSGIIGRLSASTLRGKIQNLPLYLSRSHEDLASHLSGGDCASPCDKAVKTFSVTGPCKNEGERLKMSTTQTAELKVDTTVSEEVTDMFKEIRKVVQDKLEVEEEEKQPDAPELIRSPSFLKSAVPVKTPSVVVTTQNLNGPWSGVPTQDMRRLQEKGSSLVDEQSPSQTSGYGRLSNCEFKPTIIQPQSLPGLYPHGKAELSCSSTLAAVCETVIEGAQTPMEVCGCQTAYSNCFSNVLDSSNFDDELTVYEFSCRTQQRGRDRVALMMSIPPSSLSGSSSSFSPSSPLPAFPRVVLPPSSVTELGPLLSPLDTPDFFLSDPLVDAVNALLARHYPLPPKGFLAVQKDIETLLTVLAGAQKEQSTTKEHPREACANHFSENKRRLHIEARGLLAGCQKVVKSGQTPAETLQALAESFYSLVQLTAVCLSFSSCQRCQERHCQALSGLSEVAQTYQEFARAAERLGMATERRTCHELSIKLLARQCTALTTSVFCLTQLFRTLTAL